MAQAICKQTLIFWVYLAVWRNLLHQERGSLRNAPHRRGSNRQARTSAILRNATYRSTAESAGRWQPLSPTSRAASPDQRCSLLGLRLNKMALQASQDKLCSLQIENPSIAVSTRGVAFADVHLMHLLVHQLCWTAPL